ncbi:hypothetical protein B484DRAFT_411909 [Ochromonadaceae sp. CCMP2298]|nr:hypothetical protein B484DRAFT_411909 [Ochromonadaceae sp. CCMP2298]
MFYPSFKAKGYAKVSSTTRSLDLFDKDVLIVPINKNLHWSLAVILRPGALSAQLSRLYAEAEASLQPKSASQGISVSVAATAGAGAGAEGGVGVGVGVGQSAAAGSQDDLPCILHMDSLGMHNTQDVGRSLQSYLGHEWENRKMPAARERLVALLAALRADNMEEPQVCEEKDFWDSLGNARSKLFHNIAVVECNVPKQPNGYDCGVCVLTSAQLVMRKPPSSTLKDIKESLPEALFIKKLSQQDYDKHRLVIRDLIDA